MTNSDTITSAVAITASDIRRGRFWIPVVVQQLVQSGPVLLGVRDAGMMRVRREDLQPSKSELAPLRFGGCLVRIATTAERRALRGAELAGRDSRPWHLWAGRPIGPTPCTEAEIVLLEAARHSSAERRMSPDERRSRRDVAKPSRPGARRRRRKLAARGDGAI